MIKDAFLMLTPDAGQALTHPVIFTVSLLRKKSVIVLITLRFCIVRKVC